MTGFPKGETRKKIKARLQRRESQIKKDVRAECVERDGYCRVASLSKGDTRLFSLERFPCKGFSQWSHLGDLKRARTRGMAPEIRHTTAGSLQMCQRHHEDYDHGRMPIAGSDANQPLVFERAS